MRSTSESWTISARLGRRVASTAPLRTEIERLFPERPFLVEFWDGNVLPSTNGGSNGDANAVFKLKSPKALAHILKAPGQLGVGRAYVTGHIDVPDLDAAMR